MSRQVAWWLLYGVGLALRTPLGDCYKLGEGTGIRHRHIGQHFAVDNHAGLLQSIHEPAIGESLLPCRGIDPDDPKAPEIALALTAMAIRVAQGLQQRLVGAAVEGMFRPTVPLRLLEHLFMTTPGYNSTFYSGQVFASLKNRAIASLSESYCWDEGVSSHQKAA